MLRRRVHCVKLLEDAIFEIFGKYAVFEVVKPVFEEACYGIDVVKIFFVEEIDVIFWNA
jgi:hypothetical protein